LASLPGHRRLATMALLSRQCIVRLPDAVTAIRKPSSYRVPGRASALGQARRWVRTGFFPEDADYIDPELPLMSERVGSRWRYMDDPTLRAPVLERSNVGMGMIVLNRPQGFDLPAVNLAYRKLRDLEVNSFKRFVGLTAPEPSAFAVGLDPRELLLAATAAARRGRLPHFSRALLWHHQELAHLIADYRKPLVCHISGLAKNGGAATACLANFSGAHDLSEVKVDACTMGLVPDGGMTYILARLRWNLGEFMALTGWSVKGADLVYLELARHWLSPDALPFLELTAEKQLEVSEIDGRALLDEHSLPLPEGLRDTDSLPKKFLPLIDHAFAAESVPAVASRLEQTLRQETDADTKIFVTECLERMKRASPLALHAAFHLIRKAKLAIQEEHRARFSEAMTAPPRPLSASADLTSVGHHGEHGALVKVLRLELRVQQRLLTSHDAVVGLHARCLDQPAPVDGWSRRDLKDVIGEEEVGELMRPPEDAEDFSVAPRTEFPFSQHPRLRRYHPDYNPATGLDHDPAWMAAEMRRWSPSFFEEQRRQTIEDLLGGADPALYGFSEKPFSRFVRVEPSKKK